MNSMMRQYVDTDISIYKNFGVINMGNITSSNSGLSPEDILSSYTCILR
jgi:hypothetical protein